jgi:hypothetical protein
MFRKVLIITALLVVLTLGLSASASAQWISDGFGGYGGGYGGYPTFHNTSHYDYHPAHLQQHGNHFHYVPGHYDYHQTGHYHW